MSTLSIETVVILGLFRKGVRTIKPRRAARSIRQVFTAFTHLGIVVKGGDDTSPVRRSANLYVLIRMPRIVIVIDIRDMGRIVFCRVGIGYDVIGVIRYSDCVVCGECHRIRVCDPIPGSGFSTIINASGHRPRLIGFRGCVGNRKPRKSICTRFP